MNSNIPVTKQANREIKLYIKTEFQNSVETQFKYLVTSFLNND